ncbi:MAG: phospholipase D-like domain-containing protein, partial [Eubacteriales bacterium]|nr:phospholipase D-like domain-containing protein [Eubacteriales bacterium]
KAKHFIFLEYYILAEGRLWDELRALLLQKKAEGVDVRIIYDDLGSIRRLPADFPSQLERLGIRCRVFHRFRPFLTGSFNCRDHRKILIIDGHTAFTGGLNLADEYINLISPYGHWLDSGILLRGEGVWSFTVMFLSMWENLGPGDRDYSLFRPKSALVPTPAAGFVQPFSDEPHDDETVGKTAFLNLISRAERYVYICTPYLIPDNELVTALIAAAKSGVDVRIITPGVPDKWFVHTLTHSYYPELIRAGVRVYEYSPGFIHGKTLVCDDELAICGTINFDYRSFYLQYECGVWMYRTPAIAQMHEDFLRTLERCEEITAAHCDAFPLVKRIMQGLLRIFAPLL